LAITSFLLFASACGHDSPAACPSAAPATKTVTVPATTTTPPVVTSNPPSDPATLPLCEDVKNAGLDEVTPDCKLISHDSASYTFVTHYSRDAVTIDVTGRDGKVLQTLWVENIFEPPEPFLADLEGAGRDELLVPLSKAGTGGIVYEVFKAKASEPAFTRAGEVFGFGVGRTANGYIVGESKSGPADHYTEFQRFINTQLVFVAEVIQTYDGVGHHTCRPDDEQDAPDSGLSDAEVVQRFCGAEILPVKPVG
jgi:hypothetical protein